MIIDHLGFNVSDFKSAKQFFTDALAPLDIIVSMEGEGWAMFGKGKKGEFWIGSFDTPPGAMHVAFVAESRAAVTRFYEAAIAAGGSDNGAPGIREQYHPNYFGAFVIGPDGHNIEAVCHSAQ